MFFYYLKFIFNINTWKQSENKQKKYLKQRKKNLAIATSFFSYEFL
jgi:hypothetical protein